MLTLLFAIKETPMDGKYFITLNFWLILPEV
jgi:hypothetical protein